MPHLFWCWILQSCARPLIVDKGTALSAAAEWRQPHAKSFLVLLNLEILPFKVSKALKAYSSNAANIARKRERQPTKPKFAQKRGTNPRSRRKREGECHAYHTPFCDMANHCQMNKSKLCHVKKQAIAVWMAQILMQSLPVFPADVSLVGPGLQKPVIQSVFCRSNWIGTIENSWDSALTVLAKGFQWHW